MIPYGMNAASSAVASSLGGTARRKVIANPGTAKNTPATTNATVPDRGGSGLSQLRWPLIDCAVAPRDCDAPSSAAAVGVDIGSPGDQRCPAIRASGRTPGPRDFRPGPRPALRTYRRQRSRARLTRAAPIRNPVVDAWGQPQDEGSC